MHTAFDLDGRREAPGRGSEDTGPRRQFITFAIGDAAYGIDIMAVREIRGWSATTQLPGTPDHVRGVINLRGVIIPILDLGARLGLGRSDPGATHVVIIVAVGRRLAGLLVDAVSDILTIAAGDIRPAPELGRRDEPALVDGLVTVEERMVTLIALDALFAIDGAAPEAAVA